MNDKKINPYFEDYNDFVLSSDEIENIKTNTELVYVDDEKRWEKVIFIKSDSNESFICDMDFPHKKYKSILTNKLILSTKFKYQSNGCCFECWHKDVRNKLCEQGFETIYSECMENIGDKRGLTPYPEQFKCFKSRYSY